MEREEIISTESDGSPHFDDERTLLSARQVVPLAEIEHKMNSRRTLGVAAALVLALALGAGAALVLVSVQKRRIDSTTADSTQSATQTANPTDEPAQASPEADSSLVVGGESESDANTTDEQSEISETRSPVVKRQSRARHSSTMRERVSTSSSVSNEPILVDQWEEKRQRRVLRHERQKGNHHRGDLFRIRDIFEGTRPE